MGWTPWSGFKIQDGLGSPPYKLQQRPFAAVAAGFAGFLALGGLLAVLAGSGPAAAQIRAMPGMSGDHTVPTQSYHAAFTDFYDGDYRTALERFKSESRGSIKSATSRWIDSICYETMQGECYYQMGEYEEALRDTRTPWNSSKRSRRGSRRSFSSRSADPGGKKSPPWQVRHLQAPLGQLPYKLLYQRGQVAVSTQQSLPTSGAPLPEMVPLEPQEIVRCTALALHRRGELLGPLAAHDPMLDNIISLLQRRAPQNQWPDAWFNVQLGMALSAGGRTAAAIPALQKATLAAGEFEHALTAMAHLELGRLAMAAGNYPDAAAHFEEASYASFYFPDVNHIPDLGVMEEAFRYGALNHLLANGKGIFPPLALAGAWAKANHCRQLYVSLLVLAAENQLVLGQTSKAKGLLDDARASLGNKTLAGGRLAARRMFLEATAYYQARKASDGDAILAKVMFFMRSHSLWLFHIQKVNDYYTGGGNGGIDPARVAIDLYPIVLRDPQPADWLTDPLESLAVLAVPHGLIFEHWFRAAIDRKEVELAIEVADRARRHRFLSTLFLGGRLESLRWVLEGPKELLPPQALLQRQELLSRYPVYKNLLEQAEALRRNLAALPLVQVDAEKTRKQGLALNEFMNVGRKQEIVLREMAVRRDPAEIAFPPLKTTAEIEKSLPPGHAMLIFFATARNLYAFRLTRDKYAAWQAGSTPQDLARQSTLLLREMGNISQNYELTLKDLAETKWRQTARELLESLFKVKDPQIDAQFEELVIVPDSFLWYLPFEALQVKSEGKLRPLISCFRIRYVPTAGLATATLDLGRRQGSTAIVVGKLHPKLEEDAVQAAVKDLSKALPGCVTLKIPLPAPAPVCVNFMPRLLVLDDLSPAAETDPYAWAPLPNDRTKTSGPLSDWFLLPRQGPDEIILPGYHSACENSLKKTDASRRSGRGAAADALGPGNEIFLALCGMMATGTRTVLLSRWRSGGQSSLDLAREFTQELPHTTPADAWQRAVQVVSSSPLNAEAEPRIKKSPGGSSDSDADRQASHPFFWAGYLLADTGCPAPKSEPGAAKK